MSQNLSSTAVMIGALKVKYSLVSNESFTKVKRSCKLNYFVSGFDVTDDKVYDTKLIKTINWLQNGAPVLSSNFSVAEGAKYGNGSKLHSKDTIPLNNVLT